MAKNDNVYGVLRDHDADGRIVALLVGYSDEDIEELLHRHPSWYRSTAEF